MKYLENNICDFEILFNLNPKIKKNIISLSFFKIYRGGYKDFNKYINGFINLHKCVIEEKKFIFTIRLFIDSTIKNDVELFNKLSNLERVEIIVYKCYKYLQINDLEFHVGTFGMFVRFFPLFDFPNNDANIVMIADMDDDGIFSSNLKILKEINKEQMKKMYIFNISNMSKNMKHNFDFLYKNRITGYFISPKLIGFKKIDHSILNSYIKNINKYYQKVINSYEYKLTSKIGKKKWLDNKDNFIYGIDEYFLNSDMMYYLIDNNLPYGIYIKFDFFMIIYYYISNYSYKKDKIKLIELILDYILHKINIKFDKNLDFNSKYKIIDNILFSTKNKELKELTYFYLYKSFLYNYENSNYHFIFKKDLYNLIKLYNLFGVFTCEFILYYNNDLKFQIHFIKKEIFHKNKLNELKIFSEKYTKIF